MNTMHTITLVVQILEVLLLLGMIYRFGIPADFAYHTCVDIT